MDKFTDKLCDLIVKCARGINAIIPAFVGLMLAYVIVVLIYAYCIQ